MPEESSSPKPAKRIMLHDHIEAYQALWERFTSKRYTYEIAARGFKFYNICLFVIPLLLIQTANILILQLLGADESKQHTKDVVVTTSSALTAFIVALQTKLQLGEKSEKFTQLVTQYSILVSEAYSEMMKSTCTLNSQSFVERSQKLTAFMEKCQKTENTMIANSPNLPNRLVKVAQLKLDELKKMRNEVNKLDKSDNSKIAENMRENMAGLEGEIDEKPGAHKVWSDNSLKLGADGEVDAYLRSNLTDDVTIDELGHILEPIESSDAYRQLWQRYYRKRLIFNLSALAYRKRDFLFFTVPLLVFQFTNTICPTLLYEHQKTSKVVTTVVAVISGAVIAFQSKLKWGEVGVKFAHCSKIYNELAAHAYFKMVNAKMIKHLPESVFDQREDFIKFLESSKKSEEDAENAKPVERSLVSYYKAREVEKAILKKASMIYCEEGDVGLVDHVKEKFGDVKVGEKVDEGKAVDSVKIDITE